MKKMLNKTVITLSFLFVANTNIQAQSWREILKDGKDAVKQGKDLVNSFTDLTKSYKKLKEEVNNNSNTYNKKVTVAKGNTGSNNTNPDNIPNRKLNKLKYENGNFTNLVWEPTNYFDGQLFPSAIISMASYNGEMTKIIESISRPIGFNLYSDKSNVPMKWEIEAVDKKYFDKISGTYMYQESGRQVYLAPQIPWNYENLSTNSASKPINIYFRIFDENGNKAERLETLQMRSINDCIYRYKDVDMKFMFSAFVQEEHKEIDNILRSALNTKMVDSWIVYQGDSEDVDNQIAAIWRVLHEKGFVYSSITATTGDSGNVRSQAVRTMDNALKTNQANCVDGTVVFASILKKIGISPILILVPGHCFLGYYTDASKTNAKFLETTLLSNKYVYEGKKKVSVLTNAKTSIEKNKAFRKLFDYAQNYGLTEYNENEKKGAVLPIDVTEYRKYIKPIPFY